MSENKSFLAIPLVLLVAAGLALAGSYDGVQVASIPLFAVCVLLAFVIQWIAFIPAYLKRTEAFFDLTGSITYLIVVAVAILFSPQVDVRTMLLGAIIAVWAVRLGIFLYRRVRSAGEDRRFRQIKVSFARFLLTWTLQGLWVIFSLAAALAAITSNVRLELGAFALVGLLLWGLGFGIEVIADWQKSNFKANPANKDKFINVGLWAWSRHPNYFGEILLWIGVAIIALPVLRGWQLLTLISPIFIFILLTRISGIPMLEARADEKWGGQPDYESYKSGTSVLIPIPFRSARRKGGDYS